MTSYLRGIIPPIVTPLLDRDSLDLAGLEAVVDHLINGGVHGIFALGTTGEFASLSAKLKREMISGVCRFAKGRVPVIAGVTDTALLESIALAKHAADVGVQAVVLSTPYYMPLSQDDLGAYFQEIIPQLPLPVYLYNIPSLTKVNIEVATVRKALELPQVVGVKDSSGNLGYFNQLAGLKSIREDWSLLVGPEELLAQSLLAGAQGGIAGGANLFPSLYVDLYDAFMRNDWAEVQRLHSTIMRVSSTLYQVNSYGSGFIKAIKCALELLGICNGAMASPLNAFNGDERERVKAVLDELGVTKERLRPA